MNDLQNNIESIRKELTDEKLIMFEAIVNRLEDCEMAYETILDECKVLKKAYVNLDVKRDVQVNERNKEIKSRGLEIINLQNRLQRVSESYQEELQEKIKEINKLKSLV